MYMSRMTVVSSVVAALAACDIAWAEEPGPEVDKDFSIGGYSSAALQVEPGGHANAELSQISLILSKNVNERLQLFGEVELEYPLTWHSGNSVKTDDSRLDVERLYADYGYSSQLNIRAGRFLSPIGIWNLVHAAPLVWTTVRPAATRELFPSWANSHTVWMAASAYSQR